MKLITLEDYAADWWLFKGVQYYAADMPTQDKLYEEWAEWAFNDFDNIEERD